MKFTVYAVALLLVFIQAMQLDALAFNRPELEQIYVQGKAKEALQAEKQRLQSQKASADDWLIFAQSACNLGETEISLDAYRQFVSRFPNDRRSNNIRKDLPNMAETLRRMPQSLRDQLSPVEFSLIEGADEARWTFPRTLRYSVTNAKPGILADPARITEAATKMWSAADSRLKFVKVPVGSPCEIKVVWIGGEPDEFVLTAQGRTREHTVDFYATQFKSAEIRIRQIITGSKFPLSEDTARCVVAHELGHAVGLPHSKLPEDVMYEGGRVFSSTPAKLTKRDKALVSLMYDNSKVDQQREALKAVMRLSPNSVELVMLLFKYQARTLNALKRTAEVDEVITQAAQYLEKLEASQSSDLASATNQVDGETRTVGALRDLPPLARASVYTALARLYYDRDRERESAVPAKKAVEILEHVPGAENELADALYALAYAELQPESYDQSAKTYTRAYDLYTKLGNDSRSAANCLYRLAYIADCKNQYALKKQYQQRALAIYDKINCHSDFANETRSDLKSASVAKGTATRRR